MIQKKKFSDAIAANISVLGGLLQNSLIRRYKSTVSAGNTWVVPDNIGPGEFSVYVPELSNTSYHGIINGNSTNFIKRFNIGTGILETEKADIGVITVSGGRLNIRNKYSSSVLFEVVVVKA